MSGEQTTKEIGDRAESLGVEYLIQNGYSIIEQNFYARKMGEIDIIAQKDGVIHFIEVKSAKANFDPVYNITPRKIHKMINSVYYYLKIKNLDSPFCLDALIIRGKDIEFIENITL